MASQVIIKGGLDYIDEDRKIVDIAIRFDKIYF